MGEPVDQAAAPGDVLTAVTIMLSQMTLLESRLGSKIDRLEGSQTGRWVTHETEHIAFEKLLTGLTKRLDEHLRKEEREELVFESRVGPLMRGAKWLTKEWRTVSILTLIVLDGFVRFRSLLGI